MRQVSRFSIPVVTALPGTATAGQMVMMAGQVYVHNGTGWALEDAPQYRNGTGGLTTFKTWTATATTDSAGDATFTLPSGYFTTVHYIGPAVERATTTPSTYPICFVRSSSSSTVIVRVGESKTTTVSALGNAVEGLETSPSGITVRLLVLGV